MTAYPQPGDLALTYRQPWGSLVVAGIKPVENRTWPPPSTLPQWMTCLGCYAEAEPDEVAQDPECPRPCACDNGYTVESGAGILDGRHAWEWVPSSMLADATEVGPFPFRLWVHAGQTNPPINSVPAIALEAWRGTFGEPYVGAPHRLRGVLLGSVLVTGCHHADEPQNPRHLGVAHRWCDAPDTPGSGQCSPWAEEGQYHWLHDDPQPLAEPIPMKGRQRLWRITAEDLTEVPA